MKTLLKSMLLVMLLSACKKEDWGRKFPTDGSYKFNYKESNLKWLVKPNGALPVNPFTVDSIANKAYGAFDGYWVHSTNSLTYVMSATTIAERGE